jgi:hypothetical protein
VSPSCPSASIALVVLLAASLAAADDRATEALAPVPGADDIALVPAVWRFGASGAAGSRAGFEAGATRREADVALAARLRYVPEVGCTILDARQELRWHLAGERRGLAPDGELDICLERAHAASGEWLPAVTAGYRIATDALPRLDHAPTVAPEPYTHYSVHFGLGLIDAATGGGRLQAAELGARADLLLQSAGATVTEPTQGVATLSLLAARYGLASGRRLAIGELIARLEGGDDGVRIVDVTPLAVHTPVADRLVLEAAAGYGHARRGERTRRTAAGRLALTADLGQAEATVAYRRGFLAGRDGTLVLEDRLTAATGGARGRHALELGGFAARARFDAIGAGAELTAGASLAYRLDLGRFVTWTAKAELGRSFFARLGPDASAGPSFGVNLATGLELHVERGR